VNASSYLTYTTNYPLERSWNKDICKDLVLIAVCVSLFSQFCRIGSYFKIWHFLFPTHILSKIWWHLF
jgi:hypothetical protein